MRGEDDGAVCIEVSHLCKRYGERDTLLDVSLNIPRGICCAIYGPNGAGKSTFLKIVASLIRPTSGEIRVHGASLPREAQRVRSLTGVLLDQPLLPREISLLEGLRYYADLYQVPAAEQRIETMLDRVGLTWRRRDPVRTFSRGMAQRASIACALLPEPRILILDEPFNGLDAAGCTLMEEIIREYIEVGRTVLLVTHEPARAERLATELVLFEKGRLALHGRAGEWSAKDLLRGAR